MISLFFDALLYAAITIVLSLSGREFKLYNLAGGAWLLTGGWLGAYLLGAQFNAPAPINPLWLILFAFLAGLQICSPLILKNTRILRDNSLNYLFISLGTALIILSLGPMLLLENYGVTIPIPQKLAGWMFFLIAFILIVISSLLIFRSRFWAKTVLDFRLATTKASVNLCILLGIEWVTLIILGALSYQIHKGIYGTSEHRTIIPILALVITGGRPLFSGLLSFLVVITGHAIDIYLPFASGYGSILSIVILIIILLVYKWPKDSVTDATTNAVIPPRSEKNYSDPLIFSVLIFLVISVAATFAFGFRTEVLHKALLIAVLATISWVTQRHFRVLSVAWPALAVFSTYCLYFMQGKQIWVVILVLIFMGALASFYLFSLRTLKSDTALVLDLAVVICLYNVLLNSVYISGPENVRQLSITLLPLVILFIQCLFVAILLLIIFRSNLSSNYRAILLGLANFRVGQMHGVFVTPIFIIVTFLLSIFAFSSSFLFHALPSPIKPSSASLVEGLTVLLLGNLMNRIVPIVGLILIFLVYTIIGSIFSGTGLFHNGIVGLTFIIFALLLPVLDKQSYD